MTDYELVFSLPNRVTMIFSATFLGKETYHYVPTMLFTAVVVIIANCPIRISYFITASQSFPLSWEISSTLRRKLSLEIFIV